MWEKKKKKEKIKDRLSRLFFLLKIKNLSPLRLKNPLDFSPNFTVDFKFAPSLTIKFNVFNFFFVVSPVITQGFWMRRKKKRKLGPHPSSRVDKL